jgi:hypothetical protein
MPDAAGLVKGKMIWYRRNQWIKATDINADNARHLAGMA